MLLKLRPMKHLCCQTIAILLAAPGKTGHEPPFCNLSIDAQDCRTKCFHRGTGRYRADGSSGRPKGLNRYDGYNFKTFRYNPGDSTRRSAPRSSTAYTPRTAERVWIGEGAHDLYDPVGGKFRGTMRTTTRCGCSTTCASAAS